MTRMNYLVHPLERIAGVPLPHALPRAMRGPLLALASALAFTTVLHIVEAQRLHDVQVAAARVARALAETTPAVERIRALQRDVERLRARSAADDALRRSGTDAANAIARIANALPDGTWLTSLRVDPATIALDGRAARVDGVATALESLATLREARSARLLSARAEHAGGEVSYAIVLDRVR